MPPSVDPASIEYIASEAVGKFFEMVATVNLGVGAVRVRSGKTNHPRVDFPKEGRPWHWRVTRLHLWKHTCGGGSGKMKFNNKNNVAIEYLDDWIFICNFKKL